jgi:formylglycine-generating enzyme required for sulfatase activity
MGSSTNEAMRNTDETQHTVAISRGFWMGKYLVTQGDYLAVVGSNPSYFTSAHGVSNDPTRPVEMVSWFDIIRGNQPRRPPLLRPQRAIIGRIGSGF